MLKAKNATSYVYDLKVNHLNKAHIVLQFLRSRVKPIQSRKDFETEKNYAISKLFTLGQEIRISILQEFTFVVTFK